MALVSLPSLMITELMACSVLVYLFTDCLATSKVMLPAAARKSLPRGVEPRYASAMSLEQQRLIIWLRRKGDSELRPRSTPLYLTNIGPVYRIAAIISSVTTSGWFASRSCWFLSTAASSRDSRERRCRAHALSGNLSTVSIGQHGIRSCSGVTSALATKCHSIRDCVSTP